MANPKGRPKVDDPNEIVKTIRLNNNLVDKINDYGRKNGLSFSKVIRQALELFFKNQ